MARHEKTITIEGGRDNGKVFFLREMSAVAADDWAARALHTFGSLNLGTIPPDYLSMGWAGLSAIGLKALMQAPWAEVKPLYDELLGCVWFVPDPKKPLTRHQIFMEQIEEASTLQKLRLEVFELHGGFFPVANQFLIWAKPAWETMKANLASLATPTSLPA